jgi:hypothetical protein
LAEKIILEILFSSHYRSIGGSSAAGTVVTAMTHVAKSNATTFSQLMGLLKDKFHVWIKYQSEVVELIETMVRSALETKTQVYIFFMQSDNHHYAELCVEWSKLSPKFFVDHLSEIFFYVEGEIASKAHDTDNIVNFILIISNTLPYCEPIDPSLLMEMEKLMLRLLGKGSSYVTIIKTVTMRRTMPLQNITHDQRLLQNTESICAMFRLVYVNMRRFI